MNTQPTSIIPYIIKPGDVLWRIAEEFNTTVYAIAVLNPGLDFHNLRIGETIFVWPGLGANMPTIIPKAETDLFTRSEIELNKLLRMIWQQYAGWTRTVMMSILYDLPNTKQNVERLFRTARDMEQTLRRYYPETVSVKLGALMRELLETLMRLVNAMKNNETQTVETLRKQLRLTADEVADYLASINSYWKKETWQELLYQYLDLVYAQLTNEIEQKYDASMNAFNESEIDAYAMADYMTNGIITQFRDRFF